MPATVVAVELTGTINPATNEDATILGVANKVFDARPVGDIDGDGHVDLMFGSTDSSGYLYLVYGPVSGTSLDLADVDGAGGSDSVPGFVLQNSATPAGVTKELIAFGPAGDIDDDGIGDLALGFAVDTGTVSGLGWYFGASDSGKGYLIYGRPTASRLAGSLDATDVGGSIDGAQFVSGDSVLGTSADDAAGDAIIGAGDVDGDSIDDLLVAVSAAEHISNPYGSTGEDSGALFVVYGQSTRLDGTYNLSTILETRSASTDPACASLPSGVTPNTYAPALDSSMCTGYPYASNQDVYLRDYEGAAILGDTFGNGFGRYLSAGDVNDDGLSDLLVTAHGWAMSGSSAFLVFGSASDLTGRLYAEAIGEPSGIYEYRPERPSDPTRSPDFLDPIAGAHFYGGGTGDAPGGISDPTSFLGDVDGDGINDFAAGRFVVFGASGQGIASEGVAETVVVKDSPTTTISISNSVIRGDRVGQTGTGGIPGFEASAAVSAAGDLNGDGFADMLRKDGAVMFGAHPGVFAGATNGSSGLVTTSTSVAVADRCEQIALVRFSPFSGAISPAGDLNADGYDDLFFTDPSAGTAGETYVIYGGPVGVLQPGDVDGDTDVDDDDFDVVIANFNATVSPPDKADGDLDCDGDVDINDLNEVLLNY